MKPPVYLDHAATTPVRSEVLEAMMPYLTDQSFGNPSSAHRFGRAARAGIEQARRQIAESLGAEPSQVIFTSGGTEADNLSIVGAALAARDRGAPMCAVVSAVEHKAVLAAAHAVCHLGGREVLLPVDRAGMLDLEALDRALAETPSVVSVMWVNNEVGVVQPVAHIAERCRDAGVIFHTDAVQAVGKVPFDVTALKADLVSISAHKIYGPKGVGALYVRRRNPRVLLAEQISGGGHERGMRSGTLNVTGIVGLGKAAELCRLEMQKDTERLGKLRDRLNEGLHKNLDEIYINGSMEHRLPHNLNISFAYVEGESLLMGINEVAVSSGSACTSASLEPSYVLKALGAGDDLAHSSIRFGLGRWTTEEEVDYVIDKLTKVVRRLREMSPLYEMVKEGVDLSKMQWVTH